MRYRTRERLLEHAKAGRQTIQVRMNVAELVRLVDLQERLPYKFRGSDVGEMLELLVRFADRQSRQQDPEVDNPDVVSESSS